MDERYANPQGVLTASLRLLRLTAVQVAGFDKPQRTRVLEREVQKNTHEKVQGGYGKYQGASFPAVLSRTSG